MDKMLPDIKIIKSPKLEFGKKICKWLNLKVVKIGENNRSIAKGLYLLPKSNEEKFMMYKTWQYEKPLDYVVGFDHLTDIYGCSEEELFYYSFLNASKIYFWINASLIKMHNPLFGMTVEEANITLDLHRIES